MQLSKRLPVQGQWPGLVVPGRGGMVAHEGLLQLLPSLLQHGLLQARVVLETLGGLLQEQRQGVEVRLGLDRFGGDEAVVVTVVRLD